MTALAAAAGTVGVAPGLVAAGAGSDLAGGAGAGVTTAGGGATG